MASVPHDLLGPISAHKGSPKMSGNNRIPMWLFSGQLTTQVKEEIIMNKLPISHAEQVSLVRHLMELPREKSDKMDKMLLRKLLTSPTVCLRMSVLPMELVFHHLELELHSRGDQLFSFGSHFDRVLFLLEGSCQLISIVNQSKFVDAPYIFGQRQLNKGLRASCTMRCRTDCTFLCLRKADYSTAWRKMRLIELKEIEDFIMKVALLRTFTNDTVIKMCQLFERVQVSAKQCLTRQNNVTQYLWLVIDGQFKATFVNNYNDECQILHMGSCEMIGIEGLIKAPCVLNTYCYSQTASLYKISIDKLIRTVKECFVKSSTEECPSLKDIQQFVENKIKVYKDLIDKVNSRVGVIRMARSRRRGQLSSEQTTSIDSSRDSKNNEEGAKLKSKYFSKNLLKQRRLSGELLQGWTIRSRKIEPKHIYNVYDPQNKSQDERKTKPLNALATAYRSKLENSNEQLNVMDELYQTSYNRQQNETNVTYVPQTRSRQKQTEILMKRIQITSCKKRKNRYVCMFNPQEIIDFAGGQSHSSAF